ncbi:MAG: hypothetical protein IIC21_09585, partial [Chloroflexi bacterium]|nr:hypothetical protein [Chloroflexota bacterium]
MPLNATQTKETMRDFAQEVFCNEAVTFDNSTVTATPSPAYSCGIAGGPHDGTVWFKFTAASTSARIVTCDSVAQDSTFAVYDGLCGSPVEIGCGEDDDCGVLGFLSDQCV